MDGMDTGTMCMYVGLGVAVLLMGATALSNVISLVRYLSGQGEEGSTGMALAAWALSAASYLLGPCGIVTVIAAFVMARIERAKVMTGEAGAWTALPCSLTTSNGVSFVIAWGLVSVSCAAYSFL